jgi:hypothetical protein
MPMSGFAVDASAASSSAAMVEPPVEAMGAARRARTKGTRAARTAETRRLAVAPRAAVRDASVAGRDDVIIVERPTTRAARDGGVSVRATSGGRFTGAGLAGRARR